MKRILTSLILGTAAVFGLTAGQQQSAFGISDGHFVKDGSPLIIKAAELHYPRIPRPYWDHRIKMSKALGMNTICLYVFWNVHEAAPGEFDFTGQNDLRAFVELCRDNGMNVILRPGPYVCAEWEMGGLPWWLLKDKDIRLRQSDPRFLAAVERFEKAVAQQVGDLTSDKGGPIIMIQVENEYGSYGKDKEYVGAIRDMLRRNYGDQVTMFQCDWSSNFLDNGLDDLVWTLNFGTGADIDAQFAPLRQARPQSPLMCSEFWSGWFDKWGANHETRPATEMIAGIDEMLSKDISFSLYMTHGGTNWGHWAGANSPGFAPDVTSYDYDAPINEQGAPTQKYHMLREMMARHNDGDPLPPIPNSIPVTTIPQFEVTSVAPLYTNLPLPVTSDTIVTMEQLNQGYGSIMYTTTLPPMKQGGVLTVEEPHDFAVLYLDGKQIGTLDRRVGQKEITLPATEYPSTLDIFVEAMGRINFGRAIKDFKGITKGVTITQSGSAPNDLHGWEVRLFPDEYQFYTDQKNVVETSQVSVPGVYRGTFHVDTPADTYLDFSTWGKGVAYVNGHALGRIWNIGPQQTLYTPGCWLREGENEIVIFDILGPTKPKVQGLREPIIDSLQGTSSGDHPEIKAPDIAPAAETILSGHSGWQKVMFDKGVKGRRLTIEAIAPAHDYEKHAAIAEIHLIDKDGNRLSREGWRAIGADSSMSSGNHTPDKVYDLQESTYWSSAETPYPHIIVIDLGEDVMPYGIEILPRMESGTPGAIGACRIYISQ